MRRSADADPYVYLELYRRGALGVRKRRRSASRIGLSDLRLVSRPFFSEECRYDALYASLIRAHSFSSVQEFGIIDKLHFIYAYHRGRSFGFELCRHGVINDLDDLFNVFLEYRIGLIDIVEKTSSKIVIDVYECITCSGLPILGAPVCHFERGLISAVVEHLLGDNRVEEEECWALGNSRCRFVVYMR